MDCSRRYGNMACNGGLMDKAFEYAIDNGMCKLEDVPYDAQSEFCTQTVKNCEKVAQFNSCFKVPANNERLLREAVYRTPVAVSIEADTKTFQFYNGGILDSSNCGTELDHGVLAVGYGEEDGKNIDCQKYGVRLVRTAMCALASDDEDSEESWNRKRCGFCDGVATSK